MSIDSRDQFAIAAMQGMSANPNGEDWTFDQISEWAYKQADSMIAEREKGSVDSVFSIKEKLVKSIKEQHDLDVNSLKYLTAEHLIFILITGRFTAG